MKSLIFLIIALFCCCGVFADELETPQMTAILINEADSNDTALAVGTSSWAVTKGWTLIPEKFNGVKVMFYAYDVADPDGETFSYQLYVADYGGNAQIVGYGTGTVGKSQLSHNPVSLAELNSGSVDPNYCWVDTLGAVTDDWASDITTQNDGGADGCAALIFDRQSARTIWCRIYSRSISTLTIYCIAYGY